jgi:hypothetical protein
MLTGPTYNKNSTRIKCGTFRICYRFWCSIKDDNRTLFGIEEVDLIDTYTAMDEEEDDE